AIRERMLRDVAEVVDARPAETLLLLILEDLHWSDYATLDLLALLARRRTPARLFVLGTYRPGELIVLGHPLRTVTEALQRQGYGTELALEGLSAAAVAAYIAQLRHGIAALRATGLDLTRPSFLAQLAEAYGRTGQIDEGMHIL